MTDKSEQRFVLVVDRLPVGAVHFRIVEIVTLNAPRFAIDLRPLSTRIDAHLELGDVEWSIADFRRPLSSDHTPTIRAVLIQQLLLVSGNGIRTDAAFKKRSRRAILELIALQAQRSGSSAGKRLRVIERACRAGVEIVVVTSGNVDCENSLADLVQIDAH